MNTSAIWVLDIIIAVGMVLSATAAAILVRRIAVFSKTVLASLDNVGRQTGDLEAEAVKLMQSTQTSERHFDQLTKQLTKLAASTDTVVKVLPSTVWNRHGSALPGMLSTATRAVSAYKLVRSILSRRRS
ncbi:MAG: hypothetical protein ACYDHF_05825 [Candidatus Cryosericum sp.]